MCNERFIHHNAIHYNFSPLLLRQSLWPNAVMYLPLMYKGRIIILCSGRVCVCV